MKDRIKKLYCLISTHLEDIREESRADPLTGEVIKACKTGEGTDEGSIG